MRRGLISMLRRSKVCQSLDEKIIGYVLTGRFRVACLVLQIQTIMRGLSIG